MQETSLAVYRSEIKPTLGERQREVLSVFYNHDRVDFTNSELSQYIGLPINGITPRVWELREKGILEESQKRICQVTKRRVIAWKLSYPKAEPEQIKLF